MSNAPQTTPEGSATAIAVDGMGRPSTVTDAEGNVTSYSYDDVGNLLSLTQPTGAGQHITTSYAYTPLNQLDHQSDPGDAAHFIDYLYDKEGRQRFRYDRRDDPVSGTIERTVERIFNADGTLEEQKATGTGWKSTAACTAMIPTTTWIRSPPTPAAPPPPMSANCPRPGPLWGS